MSLASNEISAFLQERIDANDFPSAVYLVAEKGEIVFQDALGYAVVEPEKIPATLDTIYDLASLTKPLVTGLLYALWFDDDPSCAELPFFFRDIGMGGAEKWNIKFLNLLTHTSGFKAWEPFFLTCARNGLRVRHCITRMPLDYKVGEKVIYSDIGFILLGLAHNKTRGGSFEFAGKENIFDPLALQRTFFNPPESTRMEIAASEKGNEYEWQMCIEQGYLPGVNASVKELSQKSSPADTGVSAFRTDVIWGDVHDANAYFMGGVAGHAGLFSTAEEVFKIAQQFLPNYTQLLKPETCKLFSTNFTKGMNEDRSFAFQLASTNDSSAGSRMSPESFGHTGFTGTSLWIDPVKDRVFVLLTNRTHMHSLPFVNLNSVRRRFHDVSVDLLEK